MTPSMRAVCATLMALAAPLAFYSADKVTLPLPDEVTPVPPPVHRLQTYLRLRTAHPKPAYADAMVFLNRTVSALLPAAVFETHEFVPGKPVGLIRIAGTRPDLPSIQLNSHTDVVPVEQDKWQLPAFAARLAVRDAQVRLYARGAQDMKSVGMQHVEALANLYARGWTPTRNVFVTFVPDEEIGGVDGMGKLVQSPLFKQMNVGVALDEGLPRADGRFNVYYAERRTWWLAVKIADQPGHGALLPPRSAAVTASEILARVHEFRRRQSLRVQAGADSGEVFGVNVVYMKAGIPSSSQPTGFAMNVIPSLAELGLDVRVPPTVAAEEMETEIRRWLTCDDGKLCPGVTYEFIHQVRGSKITSRDPQLNPFIVPFANGLSKAGVADRLFHGTFFAATDSRFLRDLGIPCFGFTPMDRTPNLLHKHNEYIPVEEYLEGIRIFENVIKELGDFNPASKVTDADVETIRAQARKEMDAESAENATSDVKSEGSADGDEPSTAQTMDSGTRQAGEEAADAGKEDL